MDTEHGKLPLPGPATTEILKGYQTILTDIPFELTTPTGAAIIKSMSKGVLGAERIIVESIGYGAGTREIPTIPNLLRVMIGTLPSVYESDELVTIETNIDSMNPEIFPFVIEKLLTHGAHDAYLVPIIMKKGRPGIILSVLVNRSQLDETARIIFAETTTLGLRIQPIERMKIQRSSREISTSFGPMRIKVIVRDGKEKFVPEFEECKKIASQRGIPLIEVYQALERDFNV